MVRTIVAAGALALATSAFAQTSPASPPLASPSQTPNQGSPAAANSGPGSTGTVAREGTGAGTVTNNPAGAGNAGDPARAAPSVGSQRTQP